MFKKALAIIKGIITGAAIISPILSLFGVKIPQEAVAAVPATIALMDAAEELGSGTGALKKEAVMQGMSAFTSVMQTVSTGGQKETWDKVTPEVISKSIDVIAEIANNVSTVTGGDPVFDDSVYEATKNFQ
jgi:hypothetical protein